jgi:hypothetical protein
MNLEYEWDEANKISDDIKDMTPAEVEQAAQSDPDVHPLILQPQISQAC